MFREIRTSERITDRDRRIKEEEERKRELENIRRIAGREYSKEEYEAAKQFWHNLFMNMGQD